MLRRHASALLLLLVVPAVVACGGATENEIAGTGPTGTTETVAAVTVSVAGASLGTSSVTMQLAFDASRVTSPATVAVKRVVLLDVEGGATVDTLTASSPSVWNGGSYVTWNESVPPGGDLRASYSLSTPKWSTDLRGTSDAYQKRYRLRITLSVGGRDVTVESAELQREPEFMT